MGIRKAEIKDARRVAEIQLTSSAVAYKDIFPKREITEALIEYRKNIWVDILKEGLTYLDLFEDSEGIKGYISFGKQETLIKLRDNGRNYVHLHRSRLLEKRNWHQIDGASYHLD